MGGCSVAKIKFDGFHLELLHFLNELTRNNSKKWFDKNKDRYEKVIRTPALQFIEAMEEPLKKISPHFMAVPKKVGGSLMRIHRDVRFSKNKKPYKTNVGIHFRHELGKDVHCPGYYLHIDLESVFIGAGIWHPETPALNQIRNAIVEDPKAWKKVSKTRAFLNRFQIEGDSLKRPPRGFDPEFEFIDDLKRKDHIAIAAFEHDMLFDGSLVKQTTSVMRSAKNYMKFLCSALGQKY